MKSNNLEITIFFIYVQNRGSFWLAEVVWLLPMNDRWWFSFYFIFFFFWTFYDISFLFILIISKLFELLWTLRIFLILFLIAD